MPSRQRSTNLCRRLIRIEGEDRSILRSIEGPNRPLVIGDNIRVEWAGTWPIYQIICIHDSGALVLRRVTTDQNPGGT